MEHSTDSVRSVSRALALLELFDKDHPRLTTKEILVAADLPRTTVLRLLGTLEHAGFIDQEIEGVYQLGPGALKWIQLVENLWTVSTEALDVVRRLRDQTKESVNIYVQRRESRVSIGQAEGSRTVRSIVRIGEPLSLTRGSSGQILLAFGDQSSASVNHLIDSVMAEKLREVRDKGYAVSYGEREAGAASISMPILLKNSVVAALSISGPVSRFTEEAVEKYLRAGFKAAANLSETGLGPVEALLTPSSYLLAQREGDNALSKCNSNTAI